MQGKKARTTMTDVRSEGQIQTSDIHMKQIRILGMTEKSGRSEAS